MVDKLVEELRAQAAGLEIVIGALNEVHALGRETDDAAYDAHMFGQINACNAAKAGLLQAAAALKRKDAALREAAKDALSGWRYIREQHGDLYGVGWDRVETALRTALTPKEQAP